MHVAKDELEPISTVSHEFAGLEDGAQTAGKYCGGRVGGRNGLNCVSRESGLILEGIEGVDVLKGTAHPRAPPSTPSTPSIPSTPSRISPVVRETQIETTGIALRVRKSAVLRAVRRCESPRNQRSHD